MNQENHNVEPEFKTEWKVIFDLSILALIMIVYIIQFGFWHVVGAIYAASSLMMGFIIFIGLLKEHKIKNR